MDYTLECYQAIMNISILYIQKIQAHQGFEIVGYIK